MRNVYRDAATSLLIDYVNCPCGWFHPGRRNGPASCPDARDGYVKPTDLKAASPRVRAAMLRVRPVSDVDRFFDGEDSRPTLRRFGSRGPELLEWIIGLAAVAGVVLVSWLARR